MSSPITWSDRDHGRRQDRASHECSRCGRAIYTTHEAPYVRCDGCGDSPVECCCPDSRELVS